MEPKQVEQQLLKNMKGGFDHKQPLKAVFTSTCRHQSASKSRGGLTSSVIYLRPGKLTTYTRYTHKQMYTRERQVKENETRVKRESKIQVRGKGTQGKDRDG